MTEARPKTEARTFQAQRKVPGGKLVIVDGTLEDGKAKDVVISGDFFLEPEEAFATLSPALEGVSLRDSKADIAARLDAAFDTVYRELVEAGEDPLRPDLQGVTTYDIAWALKRGMAGATEFYDHEWEVIHDTVRPTRENVALDEVLLREVAAGRRGPTVRFWEWEDKAAVIGSFQSFQNEIDAAGAQSHGVEVVRRISGGGAMFMEGGNCVTFSLYAPLSLVAGLDYEESYKFLDQWVLNALSTMGVNAFYEPINDITSDKGKIGGAAQKRLAAGGGVILHHDTMSYDIDADKMLEVLRVGKAKISDKGIRSAKKRVDPLRSQTGMPREEVIDTMVDAFQKTTGARLGEVTLDEVERARALVAEKFGTEEWTHRVP